MEIEEKRMEKRNILFSPPDITELEIQEVAEALRSGWITTGPRTKQLERNLAEYCHTNKVVCLKQKRSIEYKFKRVRDEFTLSADDNEETPGSPMLFTMKKVRERKKKHCSKTHLKI